MPTLLNLLSRCSVLEGLVSHLKADDLFNLALTCKQAWEFVASQPLRYEHLKLATRCCGPSEQQAGLRRRYGLILSSDSDYQPVIRRVVPGSFVPQCRYPEKGITWTVPTKPQECLDDSGEKTSARPCFKCKQQVCNNCRHHYEYIWVPEADCWADEQKSKDDRAKCTLCLEPGCSKECMTGPGRTLVPNSRLRILNNMRHCVLRASKLCSTCKLASESGPSHALLESPDGAASTTATAARVPDCSCAPHSMFLDKWTCRMCAAVELAKFEKDCADVYAARHRDELVCDGCEKPTVTFDEINELSRCGWCMGKLPWPKF